MDGYVNGYIQKVGGKYTGALTIDGISLLGGVSAVYFKQDGNVYLWIKRMEILDYDHASGTYKTRRARPYFEAYMKKTSESGAVAYKGEFVFMRMKYSICGVWDSVLGLERQRLNLYVERLPMSQQTIINSINEHKKKTYERGTAF